LRFSQDLGSKISDLGSQNGHFSKNWPTGLASLLERVAAEGLSCLLKKNSPENSFWFGQDLGSKIGNFGNYRGEGP